MIVGVFVVFIFFVVGEGSGVMRLIDIGGVTLVDTLVVLSSCNLLGCP